MIKITFDIDGVIIDTVTYITKLLRNRGYEIDRVKEYKINLVGISKEENDRIVNAVVVEEAICEYKCVFPYPDALIYLPKIAEVLGHIDFITARR